MNAHPRPRGRGSLNSQARLTERWVRDIRRRHTRGRSLRALAADYGVSSSTISRAVTGLTWRHVP